MNAECIDTEGSFNCTCNNGFRGNGTDGYCSGKILICNLNNIEIYCVSCTDVDECTEFEPCHANASCKNLVGSFECTCNEGYQGDGMICSSMLHGAIDVSPHS